MYHVSGDFTGMGSDPIFESIDLSSLVVTPIPLSGFNYKEATGMTYAGSGVFMLGDRDAGVGLSSLTTAGSATNIGNTATTLMGLAYIGPTLYAVGKNDNLLRTINPATGGTPCRFNPAMRFRWVLFRGAFDTPVRRRPLLEDGRRARLSVERP